MDNTTDSSPHFRWQDYLVFAVMLSASALIGVYYFFKGRRLSKESNENETQEFLMAGRQMGPVPMSMSLIASFMSAITLLGNPAEVYQHGTVYWYIFFSYIPVTLSAMFLYMPVFFSLQVTSAYEYLSLRFNNTVRCIGSGTFILQMCMYMAIVVYAPALALSQVTGINLYVSVVLIFLVCIFYTTLGGMKAVIWTDTLQVVIMYGAMIGVLINGIYQNGGMTAVWEKSKRSGRIEFDEFSPDPTIRHSFWSLVVGGYFTWISIYGVNQAQVQRYLTVPTINKARIALCINWLGLSALVTICSLLGLVIYVQYSDCDPLSTVPARAKKPDQLLPLFVMDTLGQYPGIPGLFVAGIFSGALSTVSSGLNSLAAITLEDFIKVCCFKNMSDKTSANLSRFLSVGFGLVCFGLVFVAEQLGDVLQAALSIFGMIGGPLLGVFTLGMFFPWANSIGAIVGMLASLVFTFFIGFGAQLNKAKLKLPKKELSIECMAEILGANATVAPPPDTTLADDVFPLFRLSYMFYSAVGCFTVIIIGLIVSFLSKPQDPRELDPRLISNISKYLFCYLPGGMREKLRFNVGANYKEKREPVYPMTHKTSHSNVNEGFERPPYDSYNTKL